MMFIYISNIHGWVRLTKILRSSVPSARFLLGAGMRNEAMNVRSGHASPQEMMGSKPRGNFRWVFGSTPGKPQGGPRMQL